MHERPPPDLATTAGQVNSGPSPYIHTEVNTERNTAVGRNSQNKTVMERPAKTMKNAGVSIDIEHNERLYEN